MKKLTITFVLISFVATLITQNIALAFKQQDRYSLAVMNLVVRGGRITRTEARLLSGRLTEELERGRLFFTMAQTDMERGLMINNLELSGCETIDCGIRAGRTLGVQLVVIGTLNQNGPIISMKLQMIHVGSREIVKSLNEVYEGDITGLMDAIPMFADKFVGRSDRSPSAQPEERRSDMSNQSLNKGSRLKLYLIGIGLLVAGGVGAGVYLARKDSGSGTTTTITGSNLPKPPNFP